jgi:hypothetical protein
MPINRAPFNALVDDDGSNTVGSLWNKSAIQTVLLDPIDAAIALAWAAYTPVWGALGTAPALGNGSLSGYFARAGGLGYVELLLTIGSSSTLGSFEWVFTLPPTSQMVFNTTGRTWLIATGRAYSTAQAKGFSIGGAIPIDPTKFVMATGSGQISGTVPFAWIAGDSLELSLVYRSD